MLKRYLWDEVKRGNEDILAATRNPPPDGDYVWDGQDQADRPLTREEMRVALEADCKGRGRPKGAGGTRAGGRSVSTRTSLRPFARPFA